MTFSFSVALCDHVDRFGRSPAAFVPIKCDPYGITNSGMETKHNHQGILYLFLPRLNEEEEMIKKIHGIDRHKKYSTISTLNREGQEIEFQRNCYDLKGYVNNLDPEDAVVIEASTGSFYWADLIETKGALCYVLDPRKFKIIRDSWNKTDKHDARNMSKAFWVYVVTGEFGIPTVYKPDVVIRELRKLFTQYNLLNRQIRMLKNSVQALLAENGLTVTSEGKSKLMSEKHGMEILKGRELTHASRVSIEMSLKMLWRLVEEKEKMGQEIILSGEPLKDKVKLLITIKGITPLSALAFLADIGDVERFKKLKNMNAYLGLVPREDESGGKSRKGHINRESRKLTRTLLTQSVIHVSNASPYLREYYVNLTNRRGTGRARIALIRKLCGIMRRMLLNGEKFRWINADNFERKLKKYERELIKIKEERKSA